MTTSNSSLFSASDFFQGPSRDQRNHWITITQTALSTEMLMKTSGTRTKWNPRWITRCLRSTKSASSSAVNATSQIGVLHCAPHMAALSHSLRHSNFRTHALLNELRVNGLKGELVDFVWVDFTLLCTLRGLDDKLNVLVT